MKMPFLLVSGVWFIFLVSGVRADTRYVNVNNASPVSPYTSWATAATNIQQAIDLVSFGPDLILVTNGVYRTGSRKESFNATTNRVSLHRPVKVQSVNGPTVTIIEGYQIPGQTNGDSAIRCAYVADNASLVSFTLTQGATVTNFFTGGYVGGGVCCQSTKAVLSNCVIVGNSAINGGGGAIGTFNNCLFTGNTASFGGGVILGILKNCTISGNSASIAGGGVFFTEGAGAASPPFSMSNCIVYANMAPTGPNYFYASGAQTFSYSCTMPMPTNGFGNITNDPAFVDPTVGDFHLQSNSPCINAGRNDYAPGRARFGQKPAYLWRHGRPGPL